MPFLWAVHGFRKIVFINLWYARYCIVLAAGTHVDGGPKMLELSFTTVILIFCTRLSRCAKSIPRLKWAGKDDDRPLHDYWQRKCKSIPPIMPWLMSHAYIVIIVDELADLMMVKFQGRWIVVDTSCADGACCRHTSCASTQRPSSGRYIQGS